MAQKQEQEQIISGDHGDTAVSMTALFAKPTIREQYRAASQLAATLEQNTHYLTAAQQWMLAFGLAPGGAERHWCECRAHLCERRAARNKPAT
ncbi:ANR family transcriptional regulator [Serratia marcescens]